MFKIEKKVIVHEHGHMKLIHWNDMLSIHRHTEILK